MCTLGDACESGQGWSEQKGKRSGLTRQHAVRQLSLLHARRVDRETFPLIGDPPRNVQVASKCPMPCETEGTCERSVYHTSQYGHCDSCSRKMTGSVEWFRLGSVATPTPV